MSAISGRIDKLAKYEAQTDSFLPCIGGCMLPGDGDDTSSPGD